ncbi:MAG: metallophosphoesterase [Acidobacteria bacterium]|nr:metallophosphoesterase [Acidobacteriota bacterium]
MVAPYLQNMRGDRVTIVWVTDASTGTASVDFSPNQSFSTRTTVAARVRRFAPSETGLGAPYFQHQADLIGLKPGTEYFYRVTVDSQDMTPAPILEHRFRTADAGAFTFLALGDSGPGTPAQKQVAQLMQRERPAFVLHTGDLAYEQGTFAQFQRYFSIYKELARRMPFFPSPGNHEYETNAAFPYLSVHAPPTEDVPFADRGRYYSFDCGNVHFISLDSNLPLTNAVNGTGAMLQWLESDLQKTRQTWRVVYFHHLPYPTSVHQNDPVTKTVRDFVVPILDRYPIDLVLNGHEHNYQRSYPLRGGEVTAPGLGAVYVVTGGGGGSLYPVFPRPFLAYAESANHYLRVEAQGLRMTVHAIRVDGQEIDNFTLEPRVTVPPPPPPPSLPEVSVEAVVNAASFVPSLAPGMLVSLFGRNLAPREDKASSLPLTTQLAGTTVTVGGRSIPLLYVSPAQINAQLPFEVLGRATLRVTTPSGFGEAPLVISEAAPGIFSPSQEPAMLHPDGTLVSAANPAETGETLAVFLTGLGDVNGRIDAGQPAPVPPLTTLALVQVQVGNLSVTPVFAGLAPGFAGLYQVNWQVPKLPTGRHLMRVMARDAGSNPVTVYVK